MGFPQRGGRMDFSGCCLELLSPCCRRTSARLEQDVAQFASALRQLPAQVHHVFVPTWIPLQPAEDRRRPLDMDPGYGIAAALMRMNLELAGVLQSDGRAHIL
jgi:hypothetical protein